MLLSGAKSVVIADEREYFHRNSRLGIIAWENEFKNRGRSNSMPEETISPRSCPIAHSRRRGTLAAPNEEAGPVDFEYQR
jgi:hypothetical protein